MTDEEYQMIQNTLGIEADAVIHDKMKALVPPTDGQAWRAYCKLNEDFTEEELGAIIKNPDFFTLIDDFRILMIRDEFWRMMNDDNIRG